jgi:hypothetical protein
MKKRRATIYLNQELMSAAARYARDHGKPFSVVAEAAIASFLTPDSAQREAAAAIRRLDGLSRAADRLERDVGIAIEMQALFLKYWLTATPALPEAARAGAQAMGSKRFETFVASLGRRLNSGTRFTRELSFDVPGEAELEDPL